MGIHFEELWEKCEKLHQENNSSEAVATIVDELLLKVNLYKMVDGRIDIPIEEREKVKSRTMGEILLTLTHLSLKDNINVFDSLNTARQIRSNENKIPPELRLPK